MRLSLPLLLIHLSTLTTAAVQLNSPSLPLPTALPTTLTAVPIATAPTPPLPTTAPNTTLSWTWSLTTSSRHHWTHWEPIPIFNSSCDCPDVRTVPKPCWATDALMRCEFENLHSFVCWTSANFGCPSPTRVCSTAFTPSPITGHHPCDLGPNPPLRTTTLITTPVVSITPTITPTPTATITATETEISTGSETNVETDTETDKEQETEAPLPGKRREVPVWE